MKKRLIFLAVLLCVFLLVSAGIYLAVYHYWCAKTYSSEIFDQTFCVNYVLYSQNHIHVSYAATPEYYLSNDGRLYHAEVEKGKYKAVELTGHMEKTQLSSQTFDERLYDSNWLASDINSSYVREHNREAWYGRGEDGRSYYMLLQDNGDVFLCFALSGGIYQILWLDDMDDADAFYDYIDRMNEWLRDHE